MGADPASIHGGRRPVAVGSRLMDVAYWIQEEFRN